MINSRKGKLYIVPTPIGNLQDITYRAVEVLKTVDLIGAEDTRKSAVLLSHYKVETPTFSYHKFNERSRVEKILEKLSSGKNIAIISDAGTPGISDPAQIIIREVLNSGMEVETLPGPAAFLPALVSSGLATDRFQFIGFLPEKKSDKVKLLSDLLHYEGTLIFYEAPHRLVKFIAELLEVLGNRKVVIAREISKIYETYVRTSFSEFVDHPEIVNIKGEFVVIVEGYIKAEIGQEELEKIIRSKLSKGTVLKKMVKEIADETGLNKNRIYEIALQLKRAEKD
ncbi:16S rRNA (cytidine(1402)-2'-O)-methyltransferase [Candidatus Cloacimonadota bacterium]